MTLFEIQSILTEAEKATPGPWEFWDQREEDDFFLDSRHGVKIGDWNVTSGTTAETSKFIASSRTNVPLLCHELIEAKKEIRKLNGMT